MSSRRLKSFTQMLIGIAVFLVTPLAWTTSASATCGDHLLSHSAAPSNAMTKHLSDGSTSHQPLENPRPPSPCRGVNCSKGTPLVPSSPPVKVPVEEQPCWFAVGDLAIDATGPMRRTPADDFRLPERQSVRLDRPPCAA